MNCKPGDFAVIVNSYAGNDGKIVQVLNWCGKLHGWVGDDRWYVKSDRPIPAVYSNGGVCNDWHLFPLTIQDSHLRPIRDPGDDATDETLVLLGKPEKETV